MKTVDIGEAKTHLSRLIDLAAQGEPFVITKGGKPLVHVTAIPIDDQEDTRRIGFMKDTFEVPDDFDTMFAKEIEEMFEGRSV